MRVQAPSRCHRLLRQAAGTALFLAAAASLACGGGGGGGGDSGPSFNCSDSPVGVNTVALVCGTKVSGNTWSLKVVIEGTTSADISGFNFDIVFPVADLSYVSGSAELGTYFSQGGSVALFAADLASNDPGRLVVGIQLPDQAVPVQGGPGQNLIMTLRLKANSLTAFGPDLIRFENTEAVDSTKAAIGSVNFSDQLLLSVK